MQSIKTVEQIYQEQKQWNETHRPSNKSIIMGNYEFAVDDFIAKDIPQNHFLVPITEDPNRLAMDFMPHAFKQLLARIGYPERLFDKLPEAYNANAINYLIQHYQRGDDMLLRLQDKTKIRALVTDSFSPVDDVELIEMVIPYIKDGLVRWDYDNEQTFHLSVSFPQQRTELQVGDVVETGLHIRNSEIGMGAVTIAGYIYRLKCTNGAITGGGDNFFKYKHVGDKNRIRDNIREALDSVTMANQGVIQKFRKAIDIAIEKPVEWFENFCRKNSITQQENKNMLGTMVESKEDLSSLFGMVQAVSFTANKSNGEDAYEKQKLAIKVLDSGLK